MPPNTSAWASRQPPNIFLEGSTAWENLYRVGRPNQPPQTSARGMPGPSGPLARECLGLIIFSIAPCKILTLRMVTRADRLFSSQILAYKEVIGKILRNKDL